MKKQRKAGLQLYLTLMAMASVMPIPSLMLPMTPGRTRESPGDYMRVHLHRMVLYGDPALVILVH